ncbi:hypothetical protein OBV_21130 [Oscillibacter valericigenes Sjm18-20]|nr:hypothetical protein OBV_21130 [Oscillibacter valericigenes Sjm18-20]
MASLESLYQRLTVLVNPNFYVNFSICKKRYVKGAARRWPPFTYAFCFYYWTSTTRT